MNTSLPVGRLTRLVDSGHALRNRLSLPWKFSTDGRPLASVVPIGWLRALPVLIITGGVLIDFAMPTWFEVRFLLAAVPPLAAITFDPLRTASLSLAACAASVFLGFHYQIPEELITLEDLGSFSLVALLCVLLAMARSRGERRLSRMRSVTETMVRTLLLPMPSRLGRLSIAGFYRASDESAGVGGDCYDFQQTTFGTRALVADVRGKGLEAVGTTAAVLGTFREAAHHAPDLPALVDCLEARLERHRASLGSEGAELFVTAELFEFSDEESVVRIANCGHPSSLLIRRGAVGPPRGHTPGLPLGLRRMTMPGEEPQVSVTTERLGPGDVLLAYTDGVTETRNRAGEFYPLRSRLTETVSPERMPRPRDVTMFVEKDLLSYGRRQKATDDVAVVAMSATGS
ncbi:PP2C family protein-serine/threonine phosphatase [Streptomyces sp. NPDC048479]|uniref:PP2C family protein-serine/threonine phosphatase n=1 Tax=Streptomyces sp. NPDC048479 TaxID=3154725 RepID=UPI00342FF5A0